MAQEQGSRAETIVDIFIAVHVPFSGTQAAFDDDGRGVGPVSVIASADGGEYLLEPREEFRRPGGFLI